MRLARLKLFFHLLGAQPNCAGDIAKLRQFGLIALTGALTSEIILVAQLYPVKWIIDGLTQGTPKGGLYFDCLLMLSLALLGTRLNTAMEKPRTAFFWKLWSILWNQGHRHQLRLSTDWHITHSTGEKDSILGKNIVRVESLVGSLLFTVAPAVFHTVFTGIGIWWLGWRYGVIASVTLVVYGCVLAETERFLEPHRREFRQQLKEIECQSAELDRNWRTLKLFGVEEERCDTHQAGTERFCRDEQWRFAFFLKRMEYQNCILSISQALLYALIVLEFTPHGSIGSILVATAWMGRIYSNLFSFSGFQRNLNEGLEALNELISLFQEVPTVTRSQEPAWPEPGSMAHDKTPSRPGLQSSCEDCPKAVAIDFRDVSFRYPQSDRDALRGINLTIPPNACVALVGPSGSGKSTLASLLMREFDPTTGAILVGETDLRRWDYDRYRRDLVSIVPQNVELFDGTIFDNIAVGRRGITQQEAKEAALQAHALEFIDCLPGGLQARIGENGIRLSAGQRQRLAIARALVRQTPILVLDEPTSALDAISQNYVQQTTGELMARRAATVILIAHRFSTIAQADFVVVLNRGMIQEAGPHDKLVERGGLYQQLKELELRGLLNDSYPRPALIGAEAEPPID